MCKVYKPEIALERGSSVPLHLQITEPIRKAIAEGKLRSGDKIEDEVSMAKRLGVSRPTTRHALQNLVDMGLVVRWRSAGTIVAPREIHRSSALTSLHDDLIKSGRKSRTKLLSYEVVEADEDIISRLNVRKGDKVVKVERLRFSDEIPLAILKNIFPYSIAPSAEELIEGGLYTTLREAGVEIISAHQKMSARRATAKETRLLNLKRSAPVLIVERKAFDSKGQMMEYGDHVYSAENYSVSCILSAN